VKITLVPSAVSAEANEPLGYLTSFIINDTVAIDAGCLGFYQTAQDQARIKHLFITHTHIDHVASLPIFLENAYEQKPDSVIIHATDPVLHSIQTDLFNNRLWPDFIALSDPKAPFLRLERIEPGKSVEVEGLRLTPVEVDHVVPTVGYIVEDGTSTVVFPSDTAPTDEIWRRANAFPNLTAVFLEATFPNNYAWLAKLAKHLTPALFKAEVAKLHRRATVLAVHIKARFHKQVTDELLALGLPNLVISKSGSTYHF
jgi:ribonuclease BN (tRNA processing enzyme)